MSTTHTRIAAAREWLTAQLATADAATEGPWEIETIPAELNELGKQD